MGNPESKQFDNYKKLSRPDYESRKKITDKEVSAEKFSDDIDDDGTPVDNCLSIKNQSEPSKISGLPGEVVSDFDAKDDKKLLLMNMAGTATEDMDNVVEEHDIEQITEFQEANAQVNFKDAEELSQGLEEEQNQAELIDKKGIELIEVKNLAQDITENEDAHLIHLNSGRKNKFTNSSNDENGDESLINLDTYSQEDALIDLNSKKLDQDKKDLNRDEVLIDLSETGSSTKTSSGSFLIGSNTKPSSLDGPDEYVENKFEFSGEFPFKADTFRDTRLETTSIKSSSSSNSSFSTSSNSSLQIKDKFSIKRLFKTFKRKKDDKNDFAGTESGKGDYTDTKFSPNHLENIMGETSSIRSNKSTDQLFPTEKKKEGNKVFGHDLPIEIKHGFKQKLTWRTNDNRMYFQGNRCEEEPKQSYGIYSNVIFLPDKGKGASPKRQIPKRLGRVIPAAGDYESDSDNHSISSRPDNVNQLTENAIISPLSSKSQDIMLINDTPDTHSSLRVDNFENELEFVDDHFGLFTGCSASGISKDYLDNHLCKIGPCCSFVDHKQYQAEEKNENMAYHIQSSSKVCKEDNSQNLTKRPEMSNLTSENNHSVDSKPKEIEVHEKCDSVVSNQITKSVIDNFMTEKEAEVIDSSASTQRTICSPTFGKKCTFDINWKHLRSKQGCFARNMKSSSTNIAEDNRICFEFSLPFYEGRIDNDQNYRRKSICEQTRKFCDQQISVNSGVSGGVAKSPSAISHIEVIVNDFDDDDAGSESCRSRYSDGYESGDESATRSGILADTFCDEISPNKEPSESSENKDVAHETEDPNIFVFEHDFEPSESLNEVGTSIMYERFSFQNASPAKYIISSKLSNNTLIAVNRLDSTQNEMLLQEVGLSGEDKIDVKASDEKESVICGTINKDSTVKLVDNKSFEGINEQGVMRSKSSAESRSGITFQLKRVHTRYERDNRLSTYVNKDEEDNCDASRFKNTCSNQISKINKIAKPSHSHYDENVLELNQNESENESNEVHFGQRLESNNSKKETRETIEENGKMKSHAVVDVLHFGKNENIMISNGNVVQILDAETSENKNVENKGRSDDYFQHENLECPVANINCNSFNGSNENHSRDEFENPLGDTEVELNLGMSSSNKFCTITIDGLEDEVVNSSNKTVRQQGISDIETHESTENVPVTGSFKQLENNEMKQNQISLCAELMNQNNNSFREDSANLYVNEPISKETSEKGTVGNDNQFDSLFKADDNKVKDIGVSEIDPSTGIEIGDYHAAKSYSFVYRSKKTNETEDNRLVQIDYEEDGANEITQNGEKSEKYKIDKVEKDDSSGSVSIGSFLKPLYGMVEKLLPDELRQHMQGINFDDMLSVTDFQSLDITLPPHEFQKRLEEHQKKLTEKLFMKFSETEDERESQTYENEQTDKDGEHETEESMKTDSSQDKESNESDKEENDSDRDSNSSDPQSFEIIDEEIEPLAQLDDANWDAVVRLETVKCRQATEIPPRLRCTVLCVDISGSMVGDPWNQMRSVLEMFVKGIEDVRVKHGAEELVSIVTFGHETKVALTPTTNYTQIMPAFDKLEVHGNTPLEPVFFLALFPVLVSSNNRYSFRLHGRVVRHRVILLTDGHPTPHQMLSENDFVSDSQAKQAVDSVIKKMKFLNSRNLRNIMNIHCVPIGSRPNMELLEIISKKSGGQIIPCTDIQRLSTNTHDYLTSLQITRHLLDSGTEVMDKDLLKSIISTLNPDISSNSMDQMLYEIEYEFKMDRKQKKKDQKNFSGVPADDENDSDSDSDESSNSNGMESDSLTEVEGLPKIGTRVKRGPDFDPTEIVVPSETGTITGHSLREKKCLFVMWDCGVKTYCRYGEKDCYDVMIDDIQHVPCKVEDRIRVGHRVRRGPQWQFGNQDGGSDQLGTVYDILDGGVEIRVRWDNGNFGRYRYNYDGAYDVLLSSPDDPFDVLRYIHEMNRRNFAKIRGIDINSEVNYRHERLDLNLNESLFGLDLHESTKNKGDSRLNKNAFVQHRNKPSVAGENLHSFI